MSQGGNSRNSSGGGGGGGITQIDGDTGSTVGPIVSFTTSPGTGITSSFSVVGSTATLDIALSGSPSLLPWNTETTSAPMVANNGYISNSPSLVNLTLPAVAPVGSIIEIAGVGTGGWRIVQLPGQSIILGNQTSTIGVSGGVSSAIFTDAIRMLCVVNNSIFKILSSQGNVNVF